MKIKFHGFLKKLCPKDYYEVDARTAAEGIRGLTNQLKQLRRIGANRWCCRVKECPNRDDLYTINENLQELNLYPDYSPAGGGGGGTMQIIIGVIIIVAAVAITWATAGLGAATFGLMGSGAALTGTAATLYTGALMMGAGLILSGIAASMVKVPKVTTDDSKSNKYFNSGQNTTDIGTRIAIGYGKYKFYGQMLSIQQESY